MGTRELLDSRRSEEEREGQASVAENFISALKLLEFSVPDGREKRSGRGLYVYDPTGR